MTPCRTYHIDFSRQEVHEAGALLITLLAHPRDHQEETARLKRRLQDRMAAARMAIAYLKEVTTGNFPKLPRGIKRLSLNQLSEMALDDTRESMPENVEVRVWRASLPVIHLASATAVLSDILGRQGATISFENLLTDRALIEWIVRAAEEYELLPQRSRRKIDPGRLIKLRLV
jgi:hypothetical protein